MDLRGHAIIFGLSTLATTSSLGVTMANPNLFSKGGVKIEKTANEAKNREALDGYVEMGLLDDERDSVVAECDSLGNGEECKKIMEWSYANGQCNIYIAPENSKDYEHWYFNDFKAGLLDELKSGKENYPSLCKNKKSINFHYDTKEKTWKYDGYDRHSWSE